MNTETETGCDGCGREVTLLSNGYCGFCQDEAETRPVIDVIAILENGRRDWEYLSEEEKHGTVVQALQILKESHETR